MAEITWDAPEDRFFENGVDRGVLYTPTAGVYSSGVAWNGLTGVTQSPSGAEPSKQYADNMNYATLTSAEEFAATIEAFTFPSQFLLHDGVKKMPNGLQLSQQGRPVFGFSWRTKKGNAVDADLGYIIHCAYGCQAAPSEKAHTTVNDSPELTTLSWSVTGTPVAVPGFKPTAVVHIDSTDEDVTPEGLEALEAVLYGSGATPASLPLPAAIDALLAG